MNKLYRAAFTARTKYALQLARAIAPLEHSGVKGAIREVLVADLFRPLLPADFGIVTGVVISAFDQAQSAQQDVIIFNRRILPPILFSEGPALIPVESALATIEVKSKLTSTELQTAHANALSLRSLGMVSGTQDKDGKWVNKPTSGVTPMLFALDTDLTEAGKSEKDRYLSLFGEDPPVIRGICVAGRTSWFPTAPAVFDHPSGNYLTPDGSPFQNTWKETKADEHHSEILELLAGLYALIDRVALNRGRPPLDSYLLDSA